MPLAYLNIYRYFVDPPSPPLAIPRVPGIFHRGKEDEQTGGEVCIYIYIYILVVRWRATPEVGDGGWRIHNKRVYFFSLVKPELRILLGYPL